MLEQYQEEEITELVLDFANGNRTGYLQDSLTELVDSYLPIYYTDIVKEWQSMPSEYDNQGSAEFGATLPIDIYNLMSLDLFKYYSELVFIKANQVIEQVGELEYV